MLEGGDTERASWSTALKNKAHFTSEPDSDSVWTTLFDGMIPSYSRTQNR